jgi:hypothetical protein
MAVVWRPVSIDGGPRGGGFRGYVNGTRIFTLVRRDTGVGWVLRHVLAWPEVPLVEYSLIGDAQRQAARIVKAYEELVGRPIDERDQPIGSRRLDNRDPL